MPVRQSETKTHLITKDDLLSLLTKNDNMFVLHELNRQTFGFVAFLEKRRYVKLKDGSQILEIVIRIISRVCSIGGQNTLARRQRFLRMLKTCDRFLFDDIPGLINNCLTKKEEINLVSFMAQYMYILRTLLRQDFFPHDRIVNDIYPALENYMNRMRGKKMRNMTEAEKCLSHLKREVEKYELPESTDEDDDSGINNFRSLSVVPRSDDVVNYERLYIPQNIVDDSYRSVDHYLSVQYRLMREDMLQVFRDSIKPHLRTFNKSSNKNKSRVYKIVSVSFPPEYSVNGITYHIKGNCKEEVDWSKKLLIPGSLVFLIHDSSVIFATVITNPKVSHNKSKDFEITIRLEDDTFTDELQNLEYKMIEPDAYFECYKNVLSSIKQFSESNFPLSDIIVYLECKDESNNTAFHPEYLNEMQYCLHEKCGGIAEHNDTFSCKTFNPLKDDEWPAADNLGLDCQQYDAFKTAITKKVAVIQGPPGTGKTYVGGKVVKALLENTPHKPIVICCLTNHALDQFLERILETCTKKIVRLGSQSESKVLDAYRMDNMMYAIGQYHRDNVIDKSMQKSLDLVRSIAEIVLEEKIIHKEDDEFYEIENLSKVINANFKLFKMCEMNYLEDDALNYIIDSHYKNQLRTISGAVRKSLSSSVLEWLACSRSSDLYEKCRKKFEQFRKQRIHETHSDKHIRDIWTLSETKRYEMFYCWRKICLELWTKELENDIESYKTLMRRNIDRAVNPTKLEIIKGAYVIGVTTTGASKFKNLIKFAEPHIMIVEEAAQVLEPHIVASLLPSIQHLILIGDHEQLRPLPASHELAEKYNLDISMFERLFRNKAPSSTLISQHRMKPCIAELLVPVPYSTYTSFKNVYEYPEILGVKSSVCFFDHRELEDERSTGTSSSNDFEARMIVSFAKYLSLQSYSLNHITIIATYAAQVALIHKYLLEKNLGDIHVTTVDNFQGEENIIVLISFVRSNPTYIGFLQESNRVCVALSRAKMGMFCFGNFQHFANKSDLWKDIVEKLHSKNMIEDSLPLKCERHQIVKPVKSEEEISQFIESGCGEICNFELPCKHKCKQKCHFFDSDHIQYLCTQPCEKMINETQICPRLCYERCKRQKKKQIELPCGHMGPENNLLCFEEISKFLPCRHLVTVPCHLDVAQLKCTAAIEINLDCGHKKTIQCHERLKDINIKCTELRPEMGPCGHVVNVPCSLRLNENELIPFCNKACGALLDCGHPCVKHCRFCFDTGIHGFCNEKCELGLSCGHKCEGSCNSPCPPCKQKCFISCVHRTSCSNECLRSCIECDKPCARVCKHNRCSKKCYEECNVDSCMKPCFEVLPCGHQCIGLCGDPCPYLCRICQADDLKANSVNSNFVQLQCDHVIDVIELNEHIENCLISLEWPCCPRCNKVISCSLRYKKQLMLAKKNCIESCDTSDVISEIFYLVDSMYGKDCIPPAQFLPIDNRIRHILYKESPRTNTLYVIKNCVILLKKLVMIAPKLVELNFDDRIHGTFITLLLWIYDHLTNASFQQLKELEISLNQLKNRISRIC